MSTYGDAAVTRQAILAAARELFAAHGVDGVSVRQVAAAAGVAAAAIQGGPRPDVPGGPHPDQTGGSE